MSTGGEPKLERVFVAELRAVLAPSVIEPRAIREKGLEIGWRYASRVEQGHPVVDLQLLFRTPNEVDGAVGEHLLEGEIVIRSVWASAAQPSGDIASSAAPRLQQEAAKALDEVLSHLHTGPIELEPTALEYVSDEGEPRE